MKSKTLLDICLNVKKTSVDDLFVWLNLDMSSSVVDLGDRYVRITCYGDVQFSEPKSTFDRWANSSAESFDLRKRSERKAFLEMLTEFKPDLIKLLNS